MKKSSTRVAFLWHMHQPCYKSFQKDYYLLPWVRLHAVKDYYGMAKIVEKFDIKVTFNFSGILLEQLLDYVNNSAKDIYGILTLKNPDYLRKEEKDFIVDRFFSINFDRYIRPNRRYLQLYNKKLSKHLKFTSQEIGDLQALFNLCWFHPYTFKKDKDLRCLVHKDKNYSWEDKEYIIKRQYDIISQIIPLYRRLVEQKKVELTVTPYHHPIMPLVYDTDILKESPYLKKPVSRFNSPHDCWWHLEEAKNIFQEAFGFLPRGSWPSEGGVCEDVLSLYQRAGFKWVGTDEAILFKSLTTENVSYDMIKNQRHIIYRPYNFGGTNIFFRDRNLSDAMSFTYQGWDDPVFAANDLLEHFKRIHYYVKNIFKERVITIIMDGENAWEYYKNCGVEFLETIYGAIERSSILSSTTPLEFLNHTEVKRLERVSAGSWINGDFGVWIGSKTNNIYWHILRSIKDLIERSKLSSEDSQKVKKYFYLIEGSDWYWWNTFEDVHGEFKNIFFSYVEEIYKILDKKMPSYIHAGLAVPQPKII